MPRAPPNSYQLRYRNDYVSMSRASIPPRPGGHMAYAACASTTCAPARRPCTLRTSRWQDRTASPAHHPSLFITQHCRFLIGCTAIKNPRIPLKQHAMFFPNRPRIAYLRAPFAHVLHCTNHRSQITNHAFLIPVAGIKNVRNLQKTNNGAPL